MKYIVLGLMVLALLIPIGCAGIPPGLKGSLKIEYCEECKAKKPQGHVHLEEIEPNDSQ